jgi:hypothetical protein
MSNFEVHLDRGNVVLVGTAPTRDAAHALVVTITDRVAIDDPNVSCITDPEQLVFLDSVLDDPALRLVIAWEPQTPEDGAVGIFERALLS